MAGFRFDTHSVAHNLIHASGILDELALREVGLRYREMDPFSVAVFSDGRIVRFFRSLERTLDSIAELDPAQARAYAAWMQEAAPLVQLMEAGLRSGAGRCSRLRELPGLAIAAGQALRRNGGPGGLVRLLLSPYGRLLRERFDPQLLPGPVSAFAAHASASPEVVGGASLALWQAFYHRVGQWHAVGGSQALPDALGGPAGRLGWALPHECRGHGHPPPW